MAGGTGGGRGGFGGQTSGEPGQPGRSEFGGGGGGAAGDGAPGSTAGGAGGQGGGQAGGAGGAGGTAAHRDGYNGSGVANGPGGGGGGGYVGYSGDGAKLASGAAIAGGAGGMGGTGTPAGGSGDYGSGGGGGGGSGAIVTGAVGTVVIGRSITGGVGGAGGYAYLDNHGSGGDGGFGLRLDDPAVQVTNNATVIGGAGGYSYTRGLAHGYGHGGVGGVGIYVTNAANGAYLKNAGYARGGDGGSGYYSGPGADGVQMTGNYATLSNQSTGKITGGIGSQASIEGATASGGGVGVFFNGSHAQLTNMAGGMITGGAGAGGPGPFLGGGYGVYMQRSYGNVTNAGTITGGLGYFQGGAGVRTGVAAAGCSIINTGTIQGGSYGNLGGDGYSGAGVAGSNLTVVNSGTIAGGADEKGGAYSIDFFGDSNTLAIGSNATFTGGVYVADNTTLTFDQSAGTGVAGVSADATLSAPIFGQGAVVKVGAGTLTLASGTSTFSGGTTIKAGTLDLTAFTPVSAGMPVQGSAGTGAISFEASAGNTATLALDMNAQPPQYMPPDPGASFGNMLNDFGDDDQLDLKGFAYDGVAPVTLLTPNGHTLSVTEGGETESFTLGGTQQAAYFARSDGNGGTLITDSPVCFASGTQIRTARGDVAVEALAVGDRAVTASGAARPIKWIGKRSFDCRAHPDPAMVRPIRVEAGAFGSGRPYRDLLLSPHHAVAVTCLDEVLIPIRLLVNGSTITQMDDATDITFWHVELDSHDILLADGLPAESYIDVGNRCDFEGEATLSLHPQFKSDALAGYCRPLVTSGAILSAVRAQLATLAGDRAIEPAALARFHLLADGVPIAPVVDGHRAAFVVPAGTRDVRLISPTWSPCDLDPKTRDDRRLGLLIQSLAIDDLLGRSKEIPLDHPGLVAGFHPLERTDLGSWRWTDGNALLDGSLWNDQDGPFVLRLTGQFHQAIARARIAEAA